MKIHTIYKVLTVLALLSSVYACKQDDDEPEFDTAQFSRLYVSFQEYSTGNTTSDTTIRVIYPADSSTFSYSLNHISPAKGGSTIYYHPYIKSVFLASDNSAGLNDSSLFRMTVGKLGVLTNNGQMTNMNFQRIRGLSYHKEAENLYMTNAVPTKSSIFVINRPSGKSGNMKITKRLVSNNTLFWGATYAHSNLYVVKAVSNEPGGIYVFNDIVKPARSTSISDTLAVLEPSKTLEITGTENMRGMSYDTVKNILAVTDFPNGAIEGQGRILLFENFSSLAEGTGPIAPTRIITGATTGLHQPVSVALDTRATAVYLYVADQASKKVSRFLISDNGNVAPTKTVVAPNNRTPISISLDARDKSTIGL